MNQCKISMSTIASIDLKSKTAFYWWFLSFAVKNFH